MAKKFDLTAQLQLAAPTNIKPIISSIRQQLGAIDVKVDVKINQAAINNVQNMNAKLKALQATLTSINTSSSSLQQLSSSLGRLNQAVTSTSSAVKNQGTAFSSTKKEIEEARTEMEAFGYQSALAIRRFAAFSVGTIGIIKFVSAIQDGLSEAIKFDREMVRLSQVLNTSVKGVRDIGDAVTSLSTNFGVSSSELLDVSSTLAQAGLTVKETKVALDALAKSALAPSFGNLKSTTEGVIATMRQFDIQAGQVESALGSINAVAAAFAVESEDIITAIRTTGGVFAAASHGVAEGTQALNQFIAVFTSVRQTTRESAESIATGLRTIFTRIQRPRTIEYLKEFGVELQDLEGKFVGPYEAIKRLSEGLNQLDNRDPRFAQITEELGGYRQLGKVIPAIQQFAVAQKALQVAEAGSTSLSRDAATAQQALAVQITKVKEEFLALVRSFAQSETFAIIARQTLNIASGFIAITQAIEPLIPYLTLLAGIKFVSNISQFASGFLGGIKRGGGASGAGSGIAGLITGNKGYAAGGLVPGSGNTDSVLTRLMPGEFVIQKQAVQAIGSNTLTHINAYAGGTPNPTRKTLSNALRGGIDKPYMASLKDPAVYATEKSRYEAQQTLAASVPQSNFGFGKDKPGGNDLIVDGSYGGLFFKLGTKELSNSLVGLPVSDLSDVNQAELQKRFGNVSKIKGQPYQYFINKEKGDEFDSIAKSSFDKAIKNVLDTQGGSHTIAMSLGLSEGELLKRLDTQTGYSDFAGSLFETYVGILGKQVNEKRGGTFDFKPVKGDFAKLFGPGVTGLQYADAKYTSHAKSRSSIVEKAINQYLAGGQGINVRKFGKDTIDPYKARDLDIQSKSGIQRKAAGGSGDGLALVMPGEFILNATAAGKVGPDGLSVLNNAHKYADGGKYYGDKYTPEYIAAEKARHAKISADYQAQLANKARADALSNMSTLGGSLSPARAPLLPPPGRLVTSSTGILGGSLSPARTPLSPPPGRLGGAYGPVQGPPRPPIDVIEKTLGLRGGSEGALQANQNYLNNLPLSVADQDAITRSSTRRTASAYPTGYKTPGNRRVSSSLSGGAGGINFGASGGGPTIINNGPGPSGPGGGGGNPISGGSGPISAGIAFGSGGVEAKRPSWLQKLGNNAGQLGIAASLAVGQLGGLGNSPAAQGFTGALSGGIAGASIGGLVGGGIPGAAIGGLVSAIAGGLAAFKEAQIKESLDKLGKSISVLDTTFEKSSKLGDNSGVNQGFLNAISASNKLNTTASDRGVGVTGHLKRFAVDAGFISKNSIVQDELAGQDKAAQERFERNKPIGEQASKQFDLLFKRGQVSFNEKGGLSEQFKQQNRGLVEGIAYGGIDALEVAKKQQESDEKIEKNRRRGTAAARESAAFLGGPIEGEETDEEVKAKKIAARKKIAEDATDAEVKRRTAIIKANDALYASNKNLEIFADKLLLISSNVGRAVANNDKFNITNENIISRTNGQPTIGRSTSQLDVFTNNRAYSQEETQAAFKGLGLSGDVVGGKDSFGNKKDKYNAYGRVTSSTLTNNGLAIKALQEQLPQSLASTFLNSDQSKIAPATAVNTEINRILKEQGLEKDALPAQLREQVDSLIAEQVASSTNADNPNIVKFSTEKFREGLDKIGGDVFKAAADMRKGLDQANNQYIEGVKHFVTLQLKADEERVNATKGTLTGYNTLSRLTGRQLSVEQQAAPEEAAIRGLTGAAGGERDAAAIARRLDNPLAFENSFGQKTGYVSGLKQQATELERQRALPQGEREGQLSDRELIAAQGNLEIAIGKEIRALQLSTETTGRLAGIQEKLAQIEQDRDKGRNVAVDIARGGRAASVEAQRGESVLQAVLSGKLSPGSLSQENANRLLDRQQRRIDLTSNPDEKDRLGAQLTEFADAINRARGNTTTEQERTLIKIGKTQRIQTDEQGNRLSGGTNGEVRLFNQAGKVVNNQNVARNALAAQSDPKGLLENLNKQNLKLIDEIQKAGNIFNGENFTKSAVLLDKASDKLAKMPSKIELKGEHTVNVNVVGGVGLNDAIGVFVRNEVAKKIKELGLPLDQKAPGPK